MCTTPCIRKIKELSIQDLGIVLFFFESHEKEYQFCATHQFSTASSFFLNQMREGMPMGLFSDSMVKAP